MSPYRQQRRTSHGSNLCKILTYGQREPFLLPELSTDPPDLTSSLIEATAVQCWLNLCSSTQFYDSLAMAIESGSGPSVVQSRVHPAATTSYSAVMHCTNHLLPFNPTMTCSPWPTLKMSLQNDNSTWVSKTPLAGFPSDTCL